MVSLIPKDSIALFAVFLAVYLIFHGSIPVPVENLGFFAFLGLAFFVLGAGIKYVDDAFDEQVFSKKTALVVAPVLGILWAYSMVLSVESATLLGATLLAVIVKLKIDNLGHQIGALSIIAVLGGLYFLGLISFLWLPLIIVAVAGIIDEVNRDFLKKHYVENYLIYRFLRGRYLMDVSVFLLALFNFIPFIYFAVFYLFSFGYDLMTRKGMQLKLAWKFAVNNSKSASIFLVH